MKLKLLSILLFLASLSSFSQIIKGKVVFKNYSIPKIEVINATSKTLTVSDVNGNFSIAGNTNDILVFVSKEHELKKITITPETLKNKVTIVELELNAEELEEVVITNIQATTLTAGVAVEQIKRDEITAERADKILKPPMIDDLNINKGLNLIRIGGFLAGLLKKEKKDVEKEIPETAFTTIAKNSYDQRFYLETLKLHPNEIELFLQFCEADPKSKTVASNNNTLSTMDFLFAKNAEFKKIATSKN
ncbi:hypothetical protein SAMN05443667_106175 [Flavobacterium gillisiae]|uniref:CarboxypepD_reg-like domain-containing protein n=1 Tax=Flavobacterium gillisiae TaxID=150146 RepID=A0A1H4CRH5_9FLAO|nr:hypothetical protein [Flavobacterium gillisiae]SEA62980.1 hypothetical protein SAMN05443667_106175 [Flavobacterium gillisiae]